MKDRVKYQRSSNLCGVHLLPSASENMQSIARCYEEGSTSRIEDTLITTACWLKSRIWLNSPIKLADANPISWKTNWWRFSSVEICISTLEKHRQFAILLLVRASFHLSYKYLHFRSNNKHRILHEFPSRRVMWNQRRNIGKFPYYLNQDVVIYIKRISSLVGEINAI